MAELTFILQKGEKIIKDAQRLQYSGATMISVGFGTGVGAGLTQSTGIGTGIFSSKQIKREGSVWDAKSSHLYVTNKRIVFCNAKFGLFGGTEKSIGNLFSEISYKNIRGINSSSKLMNPAIDISVAGQNGIENIKFWFLGKREKERDEVLTLIKKQLK